MERLIKVGHLRRYVKEVDHGVESRPTTDRIIANAATLSETRLAINNILGGSFVDQYQSKRQQRKLLIETTIKAWLNAIHTGGNREETKLIDDPMSFPLVNPNRVIVPYYDALVLTLRISGFDVHRVLVDPSCVVDLL